MILSKLVEYYDRIAAEPDSPLAKPGFSVQKISFEVVLEPDGALHAINDLRDTTGTTPRPRDMLVPGGAKPSGPGIHPNFVWDRTDYMLGCKADDPKPKRTREAFEAFRDRHLTLADAIDSPVFTTVCAFLENWQPQHAAGHALLEEVSGGFGVIRIRTEQRYVHDDPAVQQFALRSAEGDDETTGQCLLTGRIGPLARLHQPKIKGVRDAARRQSAGATIVAFNDSAYESYGRSQSYNAPVSQIAAFQYCTALNHLLRRDSPQRLQLGDATVVVWAERSVPFESMFGTLVTGAEDETLRNNAIATLTRLRQGEPAELGDSRTPVYILGLSPNAARISVRFWHVSTVGDLAEQVARYQRELAIAHGPADPDCLFTWQLLRETAREAKDIPPLLGGALMRAVLTGQRYPDAMYGAVLRRIHADQEIRYPRAAFIKAYLIRNHNMEIPMALDPQRTDPAYCLGRLFAALEKSQQDALGPSINATIKDRYFGAASATPASVFPRLIRMNQHHLGKLDTGPRIAHDKRIQAIAEKLDAFPSHLNMTDQGLFALGYYHQRQDFFRKHDAPQPLNPETSE